MRGNRFALLPTSILLAIIVARLFCGFLSARSDESRQFQIGRIPGWETSRVVDFAGDSPSVFSTPVDEHGSLPLLIFEWIVTFGLATCLACTLIGWSLRFSLHNRIAFTRIALTSITASALLLTLGMFRRYFVLFHCDHERNRFLFELKLFPVVPSTFLAPDSNEQGFIATSKGLMQALDTLSSANAALGIILIWSTMTFLSWVHQDNRNHPKLDRKSQPT